jgi:hypothetical protein
MTSVVELATTKVFIHRKMRTYVFVCEFKGSRFRELRITKG